MSTYLGIFFRVGTKMPATCSYAEALGINLAQLRY